MRVRRATTDDARAIGEILADGLADKYGPAYGGRSRAAITAIAAADAQSAGSGDGGYLVVEREGYIAGVAFLGVHGRQASVLRPLMSALGPLRTARALVVLSAFSKGTTASDEAVLDELAVAPHSRRAGIGATLVEECARRARVAGHRRLTLWVTTDNGGARALYERAGFRIVERRRWPSGRLLFGARGALKMERTLVDTAPPSRPRAAT